VTLPLYGDWSSNFWHWCYQTLPLAVTAHQGGFTGTYLIPDVPFAADTLKMLGIKEDRIRRADGGDLYLECMCLHSKRHAPLDALLKARAIFRSQFAEQGRSHRIYVSRNGNPGNMRKVVNEPELQALLERFGFITLHLENLTLAEQLAYMCNCSALVSPHGAGMTHCTFMPEHSLVLELFAPTYLNPCVLPACKRLGHRYFQVTSNSTYSGYRHGYEIEANLPLVDLTLTRELG
jgi:capsular polysaccharide biosynthesis protein